MNKIVISRDSIGAGAQQDEKRVDRFETLETQDSPVIYRKWVSNNAMVADFLPNPDYPWVEEYTDVPESIQTLSPRLFVDDQGEEVPLSLNDGMILIFHGHPTRQVSILPGGQILDEEEAEAREEQNGTELPRFTEWGFGLKKMVYTNGPEERDHMAEAQESKRNRAEEKMFSKQEEFFTALADKFGTGDAPTQTEAAPQSPAELVKMAMGMPEDQKSDLVEFLLKELDTEKKG